MATDNKVEAVTSRMLGKDGKVNLISTDGKRRIIRRFPVDAVEIIKFGEYTLVGEESRSSSEQDGSELEKKNEKPEPEAAIETPASKSSDVTDDIPEFDYDIPASAPRS
jgi:hypothetical protein